jgi:hypothetical protein
MLIPWPFRFSLNGSYPFLLCVTSVLWTIVMTEVSGQSMRRGSNERERFESSDLVSSSTAIGASSDLLRNLEGTSLMSM